MNIQSKVIYVMILAKKLLNIKQIYSLINARLFLMFINLLRILLYNNRFKKVWIAKAKTIFFKNFKKFNNKQVNLI